jgi:hypothetical protein
LVTGLVPLANHRTDVFSAEAEELLSSLHALAAEEDDDDDDDNDDAGAGHGSGDSAGDRGIDSALLDLQDEDETDYSGGDRFGEWQRFGCRSPLWAHQLWRHRGSGVRS